MRSTSVLDQLPRTPASHFRLHAYGAVLRLRPRLPVPQEANGLGFLGGYYEELARAGFGEPAAGEHERWSGLVREWEREARVHLPLRALRESLSLDPLALTLLVTVGLGEEDARFGPVFEALNGLPGEARPTMGLLSSWTPDEAARDGLLTLLEAGLVEAANADAPRQRWALQVPAALWDAMRGRTPAAPFYQPPEQLPRVDGLVLSDDLAAALHRAATLLGEPQPRPLIVRGPRSSGRHTIVGAVAGEIGRGALHVPDAAAVSTAGPLATLLHALPVLDLPTAIGETVTLPPIPSYDGPVAAVAERHGAIAAPRAVTLQLEMPGPGVRERHWLSALGDPDLAREFGARRRTTAGAIHRGAELARAEAALASRTHPTAEDVRVALRAVGSEGLETLASRVKTDGGWQDLAVGTETALELKLLERRCVARERLGEGVGDALGAQLTPGVRALFSGPSGTGKTLAARLLAASLGKDLFALNLAAVVNKYLGETEKNLHAAFSRAEELDVVLLLDEGDALMTRRTDVQTSNDRYANLETNFLLQRLESYEGILIVTTNAGDRIDSGFRRRLDVVVEFRAPEAPERWMIWRLHLPAVHAVLDPFLEEAATRCQLTGAQIRSAVVHASLLALDDGGLIDTGHLEQAIRREYRKTGSVCPLRLVAP